MNKKMKFEQAMDRLSEIVQQMESGTAPLEDTLKLYEEGTKLTAFCYEKLKNAEQSVKTIVEKEQENGQARVSETDA